MKHRRKPISPRRPFIFGPRGASNALWELSGIGVSSTDTVRRLQRSTLRATKWNYWFVVFVMIGCTIWGWLHVTSDAHDGATELAPSNPISPAITSGTPAPRAICTPDSTEFLFGGVLTVVKSGCGTATYSTEPVAQQGKVAEPLALSFGKEKSVG